MRLYRSTDKWADIVINIWHFPSDGGLNANLFKHGVFVILPIFKAAQPVPKILPCNYSALLPGLKKRDKQIV